MKLLPLLLALLAAHPVHADTWLNLGGVSWHDRPGFNGENFGLGIEHALSPRAFATGGFYHNSERTRSHYLAYGQRFYDVGRWSAGGVIGLVDGYSKLNRPVALMILPFVNVRWQRVGASLLVIPPAEKDGALVVAVQLKIRM